MAVRRFEDLRVWQLARELARGVYRASQTQPLKNDRTLQEQMKRAAISIVSNIAEGFERGTRKQQVEFCYLAKGSAGELRAQVIVATDLGLLNAKPAEWLTERCERCSRMLAVLIDHLRRSGSRIQGDKFKAVPDK